MVVDTLGFVRLLSVKVIFVGVTVVLFKPPVMTTFLVVALKVQVGVVVSKPKTPLHVRVAVFPVGSAT